MLRLLCALGLIAVFGLSDKSPCLPLSEVLAILEGLPLEDVNVYTRQTGEVAGTLKNVQWEAEPPKLSFAFPGEATPSPADLCILRKDLEDRMVFRVRVRRHGYGDGLSCVSFEEGMSHQRVFQLLPHNQCREIQLEAYWRGATRWVQLPLQSKFPREAFLFDCGIRVGDDSLLDLVQRGELRDGQTLVTSESIFPDSTDFRRDGNIQLDQRTYLSGEGLLPAVP